MSVIVQDAQGRPVHDLSREDFRLLDGEVEQEIRSFSFVKNSNALPQRSPGVFSNRRSEQRIVSVIVLDQLNCLIEDEAHGRSELLKFLRTAEPSHRIALLSLSSELKILHELTTDAGSIARTLKHFLPGRSVTAAAIRPEPTNVPAFQKLDGLMEAAKARERHQQNALAAGVLARYLRRIPGRKNLIWMSSIFPSSLAARVREDDVVIYPIDVRGVKAPEDPQVLAGPVMDGVMYGAKALAAQTGGIAFYGNNDLRLALQQAHRDSNVAYLLGYYPSHGQWNGEYRPLRVTVRQADLNVRHRMGYFAFPETPEPSPRDRREAILDVVTAPDDASAIRLDVQISTLEGGTQQVAVFIDPRTLSFETKAGRWRDELDLTVVAQKENGESFPGRIETYKIDVPESTFREVILPKGISFTSQVTPPEGGYRLRVAVRELRTGNAGSVTIPLRE